VSQRDAKGRFLHGNHGGPGRPRRQTEVEYVRALRKVCSPEDLSEIAKRAVVDALRGDARARDWLSRYLLGVPAADAPKLSELAWQEESGYDPVGERVRLTEELASLTEGWFGPDKARERVERHG
jgi:hypothetical protein